MNAIHELFSTGPSIINIGLDEFAANLRELGYDAVSVAWKPPAAGDLALYAKLRSLDPIAEKINAANKTAVDAALSAEPVLTAVRPAREVVPGMDDRIILHAGPPIEWDLMCGPMHGAVIGAILFEGWADSHENAEKLAAGGAIRFEPCHHHSAVGPMAGILSPSMPVFVVRDSNTGKQAFASINEGLGKVLRFGANDREVLERLVFLRDKLMPFLDSLLTAADPIELKRIVSQALQMGDECHNRNKASSALLLRDLVPFVPRLKMDASILERCLGFLSSNEHFFLNLSMAAAKIAMDAAHGVAYSSVVTAMTRNGTDFGIRVSGLGDRWFTTAAGPVEGLFFPGFGAEDANPDMGDSTIAETFGIGGFAMAGAIPIVKFVGGSSSDALAFTKSMYQITVTENSAYALPTLNFRGTPTGIDLLKVLDRDVLPVINTGIAHKDAGVGQIGAGVVRPPVGCFIQALDAFVERYAIETK